MPTAPALLVQLAFLVQPFDFARKKVTGATPHEGLEYMLKALLYARPIFTILLYSKLSNRGD